MKRLGSSDSLAPICTSGWLDDDDDVGLAQAAEKKRRLSPEQVRSLEKNFVMENRLEPERKARLAQDLGLQPRQVAVWFQNRRARSKTKQLERDYGALKSRYDLLRTDYDALVRDKDSLLAEVRGLTAKLPIVDESFSSIKEESVASESMKIGCSDSDSSAVLNDHESIPLIFSFETTTTNSSFSSSLFCQHLLKVEDDEFLPSDEPSSSDFFNDEHAHKLSWYCGEWE